MDTETMTPAIRFGEVVVWPNGTVTTPVGTSWLRETEMRLGNPTPITFSSPSWNGGMVILSLIVALFTCGLGLLLLFLSRTQTTRTVVMDTVEFQSPNYYYVAQDHGGPQFVSWAQTWRQQLITYEASELATDSAPDSLTETREIYGPDPWT